MTGQIIYSRDTLVTEKTTLQLGDDVKQGCIFPVLTRSFRDFRYCHQSVSSGPVRVQIDHDCIPEFLHV